MKAKTYFKTAEGQQLVKDFQRELIRVWAFKDLARSVIREITPAIESKYQITPDPENFAECFLMSYVDKYNIPLGYDSIINGAKKYAETLAAKFRSDQPESKPPEPKITDKIRGIALLIAYENDKLPKHIKQLWDRPGARGRKIEILKYVENKFQLINGKNVYDWTGYKLDKLKNDCTSEYEAGLKLYKEIF